jgi:hypothetical protein
MKNLPFAYKKGLLALRVIPQGRASKLSDKTLWVLSDSFGGERGNITHLSIF